ncbi:hypothetical protein C7974DRAFT_411955 [Boeremia exigua]|uniref:uncharacterized protein n=1 Tax=Boeremia exigua TaxID=749465 RepID=UPI001E8D273C|nr:uncharacterized protein C7974DRAFT_411955 [Boeremia exigua]KAH6632922.1 hypothetical protein C7974DRAFT_411955 [Boeremia exigua]
MAHQAHSIPWQALVDNLKFMHCSRRNHGITNLYLRNTRQHQEKELQYFIGGFSRALSRYSEIERKKYNTDLDHPELDEKVISDDAVKKMARTVLSYRGGDGQVPVYIPTHSVLSQYECTTQRFISDTHPGEGDMNDCIRDVCEQVKTMMLYGEMDSLLRVAAHPSVRFSRLWDETQFANAHGFGLSKLKDSALQAYICLNVMFLKPELYDATSRKAFVERETKKNRTTFATESYDYRLTAAYQHMLLCCTGVRYGSNHYEVHTYPHREFFGVPSGMFHVESADCRCKRQLGTVRIPDIVDEPFKGIYIASQADIPIVLDLIKSKGLPTELAVQIMHLADYTSVGRLLVRDDPLNLINTDELKQYLGYCWMLLVRLDMLCKASGQWLDWEAEVTDTICTLFEMDSPSRRKVELVPYADTDFSGRTYKVVFKT